MTKMQLERHDATVQGRFFKMDSTTKDLAMRQVVVDLFRVGVHGFSDATLSPCYQALPLGSNGSSHMNTNSSWCGNQIFAAPRTGSSLVPVSGRKRQ